MEHHEHAPRITSTTAHDHATHDHDAHDHGAHDHGAHDHSAHDPAVFRRLFWVNLVLTIPTLVFSTGLQDILGLPGPRFPGSQFIPAAFGVLIFLIGGRVFLRGALDELRAKSPGMMTLISLALLVAFGYSLAVTLGLEGMDFWWELATLITIMLLGHWIEMSAVMGAQNALGELAKLIPDEAEVQHGDHRMTVKVVRAEGRRPRDRAARRRDPGRRTRGRRRVRGRRVAADRRVGAGAQASGRRGRRRLDRERARSSSRSPRSAATPPSPAS